MVRTTWWILLHAFAVCRSGQLRFRLETFGLYYPALPYTAPWWRVSPSVAFLLVRQGPGYLAWVIEMERLKRGGAGAWWIQHWASLERGHSDR